MDLLLFNILLYLVIFGVLFVVFTFILTRRKKGTLKKKLKEIDKESKLLAIDELRKLVKRDPHNYLAREKLAELLLNNKSYLAAIKELLMILDYSQNNEQMDEVKYLNKIGNAYLLLENYDDAKKYFLIAKTKDDLNLDANLNLARIEIKNGNYEKAESFFNYADKMDPDNNELKKSYAICNFMMNKFKEAIEKLTVYTKEVSGDEEAIYYLAMSFFNLNRLDDAIKCFNLLKQSEKYGPESFYNLGIIRSNQKLYIQAIEDLNNYILKGNVSDPARLAESFYMIADCYLKTHDIQKAIEYWKKVYDINPNYKDIVSKLDNYSQVGSNYLLEMYLVGSVNQFIRICKLFVQYYIKHFSTLKGTIKFIEMKTSTEGSLEILTEVTSGNFIEHNLFVFLRSSTVVGDMTIRNHYANLKEQKADKGICVTAGTFSESAKAFVESRMIKIIEKEELVELLNKISSSIQNSPK